MTRGDVFRVVAQEADDIVRGHLARWSSQTNTTAVVEDGAVLVVHYLDLLGQLCITRANELQQDGE